MAKIFVYGAPVLMVGIRKKLQSMIKNLFAATACAAAITSSVFAGPTEALIEPWPSEELVKSVPAGFEAMRRPITNPTKFDLAVPSTSIHAIYMHHSLPSKINSAAGKLDLGGDVNLFALGFEYAFNERLSLVGTKDGYVDFNPDNSLETDSGFADLAAGVKYAFILDPVEQFAFSGTAAIELPSGDNEVLQGNGDGGIDLSVSALKLHDGWQFAGALGAYLPFDSDEDSTTGFASAHVGYNVTEKLYLLGEVNWFTVLSSGDGSASFGNPSAPAPDDLVSSVVEFEGGDLFNLGAANSDENRDIVTAALGMRYKLTDLMDIGVAYELPLTDEESNLMDNRITLDIVFNF